MALTRNKNSPNHTNSMKFNGGKSVDHPIRTEIDVGAVAPWMRIIPNHPQVSGIFKFLIIYSSFLINYTYSIHVIRTKVKAFRYFLAKKNPCKNRGLKAMDGDSERESRERGESPSIVLI